MYLSISSIYLSIYLSIFIFYLSICLSIYLSIIFSYGASLTLVDKEDRSCFYLAVEQNHPGLDI